MSILTIVILAGTILVLLTIAGMIAAGAILCGDLATYTATGAETLAPEGTPEGSALVVYNPGVTGAAKTAAGQIASDLKSGGYKVTLAGIRSVAVADTTGYDVVIVGGPIYFGTETSYTATYLKTLTLQPDARLGIFGTTGSNDFVASDLASVEQQVSSLQGGRKASVRLIEDRDQKKAVQSCKELVAAVMK